MKTPLKVTMIITSLLLVMCVVALWVVVLYKGSQGHGFMFIAISAFAIYMAYTFVVTVFK